MGTRFWGANWLHMSAGKMDQKSYDQCVRVIPLELGCLKQVNEGGRHFREFSVKPQVFYF